MASVPQDDLPEILMFNKDPPADQLPKKDWEDFTIDRRPDENRTQEEDMPGRFPQCRCQRVLTDFCTCLKLKEFDFARFNSDECQYRVSRTGVW